MIPRPEATLPARAKRNASWHEKNRMPRHATLADRVRWHRAHAKRCGCRPIPAGLLPVLRKAKPGER